MLHELPSQNFPCHRSSSAGGYTICEVSSPLPVSGTHGVRSALAREPVMANVTATHQSRDPNFILLASADVCRCLRCHTLDCGRIPMSSNALPHSGCAPQRGTRASRKAGNLLLSQFRNLEPWPTIESARVMPYLSALRVF